MTAPHLDTRLALPVRLNTLFSPATTDTGFRVLLAFADGSRLRFPLCQLNVDCAVSGPPTSRVRVRVATSAVCGGARGLVFHLSVHMSMYVPTTVCIRNRNAPERQARDTHTNPKWCGERRVSTVQQLPPHNNYTDYDCDICNDRSMLSSFCYPCHPGTSSSFGCGSGPVSKVVRSTHPRRRNLE